MKVDWKDLRQQYGPAVKRLIDNNEWMLVERIREDDSTYLEMFTLLGRPVHPFDVLCALDAEGIVTIMDRRIGTGAWWIEIFDMNGGYRRVYQSGARFPSRQKALAAAIPHAVKALDDKLKEEKK